MAKHKLKTLPHFYEEVIGRRKNFEIRENDRGFKVGDSLLLKEYDNIQEQYSGRQCLRKVTYITEWGQESGFVVMGLMDPLEEKTYKLLLRKIRDDLRLRAQIDGAKGHVVHLSAGLWDKLNEYLDRGGA